MKRISALLVLAAGLLQTVAASAQQPAPSPLIGQWAVDVSQLPIAPERRPRSVTMTISDLSDATEQCHGAEQQLGHVSIEEERRAIGSRNVCQRSSWHPAL